MASANADQSALVPVPAVGSIGGALMPFRPPAPVRARAKRKALGEEAFVSGLERIITRDFFPQLAKLRAQQEWVPTSPLWNLRQRRHSAACLLVACHSGTCFSGSALPYSPMPVLSESATVWPL